ncbi:hypothetical protein NPIL_31681 [Nephila pilipes]|uniref:Capsid protein n=1 Tax=Nephila pilipes TaxID=299642 RepID=A0A8X6QL53_NEPPI|nr:hypothetical protein NPIL_31681 [Nephila pilipes]
MPTTVVYENCNTYYLDSKVNQLWSGTSEKPDLPNWYQQNTGWKFIPNQTYSNYLTPKQHFDLFTNHDKYIPVHVEFIVQNMIPLNDNLSINQDTAFLSFNNTVYALGYCDTKYETITKETTENLLWREGASTILKGFAWDPFCSPSKIQELRPGKNAIGFSWSIHPSDKDKWYSTAFHFASQVSGDNSNLPTFDDMNFDIMNTWLTPGSLIKQDPRSNYKNKFIAHYKYVWNNPIPMMFLKLMPLFNMQKNIYILNQYAQIVIVRKITFEVTPRTNTTNYPQVASHWTVPNKWSDPDGTIIPMNYSPSWRPFETIGQPPFNSVDTVVTEKKYKGITKLQSSELRSLWNQGGELAMGTKIVEEEQPAQQKKKRRTLRKFLEF